MAKPRGYWNYETCYQAAKEFSTRKSFQKKYPQAWKLANKNNWLDDYTWFLPPHKSVQKWTYDACYKLALQCKKKNDLKHLNESAYSVALKNNWMKDYTWFSNNNKLSEWTYDMCYEEAKKCHSRNELKLKCSTAYTLAMRNGWINDYTWFLSVKELCSAAAKKWNRESCYAEAKKYKKRVDFRTYSSGAYHIALKNKWIDDYVWFKKDIDPYRNDLDNVYAYFFEKYNSIYIGRTINPKKRDDEHHKNGSVFNFAKKHNIEIPQMTILEKNLSLEDGLIYEDLYVEQYKNDGFNVLNKGKTGLGCGSLGAIASNKWTYNKCKDAAAKCKNRREFGEKYGSAYFRSRKQHWLDDFFPNAQTIRQINQFSIDGKYIKTWDSISAIKKECGYNDGSVCKCCKGKQKTAYGYVWRYVE